MIRRLLIVAVAGTALFVDSGITGFDTDPGRNITGAAQAVMNTEAYTAYRLVFTSLRGGPGESLMQVSEIRFGGQVVPEPSSMMLLGAGALAVMALMRRR